MDLNNPSPSQPAAPDPNAPKVDPNINFFALTNYRNQNRRFGIKLDDRRRHMYVVGKTGMGKTTLLENMVLSDIYAGHGVGLVDPHGDYAEKIINYVPAKRINDIIYFNPGDLDFPIGFNILETIDPRHRHLVASGLMGVFKKIWPDVWSSRMEYILNNTILALLDFPGTTLLGINRLLADADYRRRVVRNLKDPVVKAFWQNEFASYNDRYAQEAVAPIQNKIGQFLSASIIRNIVAQVKSRINIREIMDSKKIFIMNLSKGRIGEDNSRLLGGMLITKIQLSAMERVDTPENERSDFFLYVDEFQNFATESFANILSEARKYRLGLIMAHQYMEQLDEKVLAAVIGNVGTTIVFRTGSTDAEILAKEFAPYFTEEDLVNLAKYQIYLKLMIDGVSSRPFSANTMPPIGFSTDSAEKVVKVSRERYAVPRAKIEDKIMRWSGMEIAGGGYGSGRGAQESDDIDVDLDDSLDKDDAEEQLKEKIAREKEEAEKKTVPPKSPPIPAPVARQELPAKPPDQPSSFDRPVPRPQLPQSQQPQFSPQPPRGAVPFGDGQKKRKRKRKRNRSGMQGMPMSEGRSIVTVDHTQKGISLNVLQKPTPQAPPPRPSAPATTPKFDASVLGLIPNKDNLQKPEPSSKPQPRVLKPGQVERLDDES